LLNSFEAKWKQVILIELFAEQELNLVDLCGFWVL